MRLLVVKWLIIAIYQRYLVKLFLFVVDYLGVYRLITV